MNTPVHSFVPVAPLSEARSVMIEIQRVKIAEIMTDDRALVQFSRMVNTLLLAAQGPDRTLMKDALKVLRASLKTILPGTAMAIAFNRVDALFDTTHKPLHPVFERINPGHIKESLQRVIDRHGLLHANAAHEMLNQIRNHEIAKFADDRRRGHITFRSDRPHPSPAS